MRLIIQRVSSASVEIENNQVASIQQGLLILQGVEEADTEEDADWLAQKVSSMRIFSNEDDKMNLDIKEVGGDIIVVSQFTLHAQTKKGNRPSFIKAARPEQAIPLYDYFIAQLEMLLGKSIQTGDFGAMMQVKLVNDGPVTIFMDSKSRE
ncbi:MAG: D-aminoacyl-tRNA deacylase [Flavobacteriales bacterium]